MKIILITMPNGTKQIGAPTLLYICTHFNISYHAARLHFKKNETAFLCKHTGIILEKIEFDLVYNLGQL